MCNVDELQGLDLIFGIGKGNGGEENLGLISCHGRAEKFDGLGLWFVKGRRTSGVIPCKNLELMK